MNLNHNSLRLCRYTPDVSLMVVVQVLVVTSAWIREASGAAVLLADGILVNRGVGLRCAVVGRRNAVTGFAAIVTVSIIHSTIWVLIYTEAQEDMAQKKKTGFFRKKGFRLHKIKRRSQQNKPTSAVVIKQNLDKLHPS